MINKRVKIIPFSVILLIGLLFGLAGCASPAAETIAPQATLAATQPISMPEFTPTLPAPSPTPAPTATATPKPDLVLWIDPSIPTDVRQALALPDGVEMTDDVTKASLFLSPATSDQADRITVQTTRWVFAAAAPFPDLVDGISINDIQSAWRGEKSGPYWATPLRMTDETQKAFSAIWGQSAEGAVLLSGENQLLDDAWASRPAWAIVPFTSLAPRWKVLKVDEQSPIHNTFDLSTYPLAIDYALQASPQAYQEILAAAGGDPASLLPVSNRDPQKLTVLEMSGVTALVRATAYRMDNKGVLYPGEAVRDWLRGADLTHISNEIAFAANCPRGDANQQNVTFCSATSYIQLLEDMDANIIELTGNHYMDWGPEAASLTVQMYEERGWKMFGGGLDLAKSQTPLTLEHNGNRLAFIGCNSFGPDFAWAKENLPGSAPCSDFNWMYDAVKSLRDQGYLPIVTFQYQEDYTVKPTGQMKTDFRRMVDAGAVIVSGSQSHVPKAMEFYSDGFIHFGLGNLFFDQMEVYDDAGNLLEGTRDEFIDMHVFYNGQHISTELLTAKLEDYARPRPMRNDERLNFLTRIFEGSGWK